MVRYGLDIDFEKFMVAHSDAANLCNEFDAVDLRRRHRRQRAAGTIGESLSASRCESSRAVTHPAGRGRLRH
jgi:hypothetical protein